MEKIKVRELVGAGSPCWRMGQTQSPACRIPVPLQSASQLLVSCCGPCSDSHRPFPWLWGCVWRRVVRQMNGREAMKGTDMTHCPEESWRMSSGMKTTMGESTISFWHKKFGKPRWATEKMGFFFPFIASKGETEVTSLEARFFSLPLVPQ